MNRDRQARLMAVILLLAVNNFRSFAQAPFATKDSISINNINALVLVHGDMWWDPGLSTAHCYYPPSSGKSINFTGALWMSGYDGASQLHVAAQTYRQDGNDYWPGPLDAADTLTYATSQTWAKIWKVNRTDISTYLSLTTHTTTNTPAAILTWPAKGNANAQGAGGAALTITTDMAPFVDVNANGIYEPLAGDYPNVKGDQALWWVFSDNGPVHSNTNGKPLGVEVHAMAYAYSRGTIVDNIVYYDYNIVNKSSNTYNNFRLGLWDDMDLGYYRDDFIGFDSSHRMGITYNGNNDDGIGAGHPANSYGTELPITGVTFIVLPGDNLTTHERVAAGSYIYYNNDASVVGNPSAAGEYDNYLRSKFRSGAHVTNDFTGPGTPTHGYGSGPASNYVFTGDPSINTEWSECSSGNIPGDRRFIIASNDFTLGASATQHIVMAQVVTALDTANGCPSHGFATVKNIADSAWTIFDNPVLDVPVTSQEAMDVSIYPNPAHDQIFIDDHTTGAGEVSIAIFNSMGRMMKAAVSSNGKSVDISALPADIYYLIYRKGDLRRTTTIVKE
jgi:hypothetical protein